jgi:hypothetical protein
VSWTTHVSNADRAKAKRLWGSRWGKRGRPAISPQSTPAKCSRAKEHGRVDGGSCRRIAPQKRFKPARSGDDTLKLSNVETGDKVLTFRVIRTGVTSVAFGPSPGNRAPSASRDKR